MPLLLALAQPALPVDYRHALIVLIDDLGTDKVGTYADDVENASETRPSTPTLDLLAEAGVRFSDAWATPSCSPTRASLLTGEHPFRHGIGLRLDEDDENGLPTDRATLPQLARDAGLSTGLFGKWHLGDSDETPTAATAAFDHAEPAIDAGFQWYQGGIPETSYASWLYVQSVPDATMSSGYATSAVVSTTGNTQQTTDDALAWMRDQVDAGQRHLTVVAYNMPHSLDGGSGPSWADAVSSCGGTPARGELQNHRLAVACMDDELRTLLDGTPELEETVVFVLGDNGTPNAVAEGNFRDGRGKGTVYENGVRVPFFVADGQALRDTLDAGGTPPSGGVYGIDAGTVVADPVSVVDIYATLVELLELDSGTCTLHQDCGRDSLSLGGALVSGVPERTTNWVEQYSVVADGAIGEGAVRVGNYKLVVATNRNNPICRAYELYDLATDRWEQTDLFEDPAYADVRTELMAEVETWADLMAGTDQDWLGWEDCCYTTETWYDGRDTDCDGASDYDQDGDGDDAAAWGGVDCDDRDPTVHPGALEVWYDGVDQDCDGRNDYDRDGDGVRSSHFGGTDCDDGNRRVFPGARELRGDGRDQDCDGSDLS